MPGLHLSSHAFVPIQSLLLYLPSLILNAGQQIKTHLTLWV